MKRILSVFAVLVLLFACKPEENKPAGNDNNDNDDSGNKEVVATAIKLSKNELTLEKGANETLMVTFTPENVTDKSLVWVSSDKSVAEVTDGIVVAVDAGSTEIIVKHGDLMDKCKVTVVISAKSIKLDPESIDLLVGDSQTLTATIDPANTTDKVEWSSSEEDIATVKDGVVTAIAPGNATITAKIASFTATCKVSVHIPVGSVDLGIVMTREDGTKYRLFWAKANLNNSGLCSKAEDYGDYFAWGEVDTYYSSLNPLTWKSGKTNGYSWESYKWCNDGNYKKLTKYCPENKANFWDGAGTPDNKLVLETGSDGDDVASRKLGGKWRMPTDEEWTELRTKCTWTPTTQNGVNGCLVSVPNGNSIFLPAAGYRYSDVLSGAGTVGDYWSSSLREDKAFNAWGVTFESGNVSREDFNRYAGLPVRPVTE